jgi:prepilin-type N-terminal cleavage/methylation domain-containing protein
MTAPASTRRRAGGFTLLETLVTLVIVAAISSLLWQAMQQVARVERLLQSSGADQQRLAVQREWLRQAIESALPEAQGGPERFVGDGERLRFTTAEPPRLAGETVGEVVLALTHEELSGANTLGLNQGPVLLRWVGPRATLRYLDAKGVWQDSWPLPPGVGDRVVTRALPRAVLLDLGSEAGGPLLVAIAATERARVRRVEWESQ